MQQEADVALHQLHHPMNVHHRLLVPPAQIGTHLCLKVLQLTHTYSQIKVTLIIQQQVYLDLLCTYYTLIPLGFAGCYADLGRIYQALI